MRDGAGLRTVIVPHAVAGVCRRKARPRRTETSFASASWPARSKEEPRLPIDALALLPAEVSLHVAGEGTIPHTASRSSSARTSRGVIKRVRWLGFLEGTKKCQFLRLIDVLAMPSAFECFGVASVEALSAGLPVIVSPTGRIADVICSRLRVGRNCRASGNRARR